MSVSLRLQSSNQTVFSQLEETADYIRQKALQGGLRLSQPPDNFFEDLVERRQFDPEWLRHRMEFLKELIDDTIERNEAYVMNRAYTWNALAQLKLKAPDEFYERIEDYDSVEIFDWSQRTLFRNFEFHRYCSYPFESVMFDSYKRLFARERATSEQIWEEAVNKGFFNENGRCVNFEVPIYRLYEKSGQKKRIIVKPKFVAPIFRPCSGEIAAIALVKDFRLVPPHCD